MSRSSQGFTVIELLVAAVVLAILLGAVALYFSQQTRAASDGQAWNDVELSARTVAEGVLQDLQLAGSRAAYIGGAVDYVRISDGCSESTRATCVLSRSYGADGSVGAAASDDDVNGYTVYYRSSLFAAEACRRVDFAHLGTTLYRSDVECSTGVGAIDLENTAFAENVTTFSIDFRCSDGSEHTDPADCYASTDQYVSGAVVTVTVTSPGRSQAVSEMALSTLTPNMRPSIDYLRDAENSPGEG